MIEDESCNKIGLPGSYWIYHEYSGAEPATGHTVVVEIAMGDLIERTVRVLGYDISGRVMFTFPSYHERFSICESPDTYRIVARARLVVSARF